MIFFSKQIRWLIILYVRNLEKLAFNTGFTVHNIHLYLCGQVENTKWILCSRKKGAKCSYLNFWCTKSIYLVTYAKLNYCWLEPCYFSCHFDYFEWVSNYKILCHVCLLFMNMFVLTKLLNISQPMVFRTDQFTSTFHLKIIKS